MAGALVLTAFHYAGSQISDDAVVLTLRVQQGIRLDSALAMHIDSGLTAARLEVDTLETIHAFPTYLVSQLIVNTAAPWSEAWRQGDILTGEPYIDSLATTYELLATDGGDVLNYFVLFFAHPLNMELLAEAYASHPDMTYAGPNIVGGDGDNIEWFEKDDILHFAFSKGWGDCPSGCTERYYWYVSVTPGNAEWEALFEEERYRDWWNPHLYRWNIPDWYPMTVFENVDVVFDTMALSIDWWKRKHAIEGTWRFFVRDDPWGDPNTRRQRWDSLRAELHMRVPEVFEALEARLQDEDPDVRESAQLAIDQIRSVNVEEGQDLPAVVKLHQNYPNPFNPVTAIRYSTSVTGKVRVKVYDTLGRHLKTLVDQIENPGERVTYWDGTNNSGFSVASGVYYYRLELHQGSPNGGMFAQVRKMLLLR
jgi:hypothetical protein